MQSPPAPALDVARPQKHARVGRGKARDANADAGPQFPAHDLAVDLSAGKEGQHDRAEAGEKVDPWRDVEADGVAGDGSTSATDMAVRIEMIDASNASPIQRAEASQTFSMRILPPGDAKPP